MKRTIEQIKEIISTRAKKLAGIIAAFWKKSLNRMRERKALTAAIGTAATTLFAVLLLMYGPYKGLSDLFITTAMHTSDHRYLAELFYSDEYIDEVLSRNGVYESHGFGTLAVENGLSEDILFERISDNGFFGYMLRVADPSRIRIVPSLQGGELLENIAQRYDAFAAINASGYVRNDLHDEPNGLVMYDGQISHTCEYDEHSFFGIMSDGNLSFGTLFTDEIIEHDFRSLIDFGPVLILNGSPNEISGYGTGMSARTAIGQTASGEVLLLVIDGMQLESFGATLEEVQSIMLEYGAINAIALDGGSSSSMYYNGEIVNNPSQGDLGRILPNAIIII